MDNGTLFEKLKQKPAYEKYLYRYGYLITDNKTDYSGAYSFLKKWLHTDLDGYQIWVHPDQKLYTVKTGSAWLFLIGHCYNPFSMLHEEKDILMQLAEGLEGGNVEYCKQLSELTGIFVTGYIVDHKIYVYGDAAGMFMTYYGVIKEAAYISSHVDLLGNILSLQQSEYVKRLTAYRFYPLFGHYLPGNISPYNELKRLVPNHFVKIYDGKCTVKRFFPVENWGELCQVMSLEERADRAAQILKNTMELIPRKWEQPAISLTGGCDSKTTLACAVGQYSKYSYFSYVSHEAEKVDAEGARTICEKLGLPHTIYTIPEQLEGDADLELIRDIISANQGYIGKLGTRETQKRAFLAELDAYDVEVKSWVSEIARAYYHKRFAKQSFPKKPTPRYLTTLYKVFFHDRKLIKETDRIFAKYIENYLQESQLCGWSWLDLFFWEFRVGSWNGLVITGEHRYSGEITIPFNNRNLIALMLAIPVERRLDDNLYTQIRQLANPAVDTAGIAITNLKHTKIRAQLERIYLELRSRI